MDNDFAEILPILATTTSLLCCCCLVLIGGGAGAFFYFRQRRKSAPASATTIDAQPVAASASAAPFVPVMTHSAPPPPAAEPLVETPLPSPFAAPPPVPAPEEPAPVVDPLSGLAAGLRAAGPIEPDDIRAKLLGLNGPERPYVVQATGYKIAIAPGEVTGYLLEIAFNYAEKLARFVETGPAGDPRLKQDARQLLEAEGWTVRE